MVVLLSNQISQLFILSIPVACLSWTFTQEEVFRELRDYCTRRYRSSRTLRSRKFFYLFTCEYCFSHYVTILMLFITRFRLLFDDWRGYIIGGFCLIWIANIYMSLFSLARAGLKKERVITKIEEEELKNRRQQ